MGAAFMFNGLLMPKYGLVFVWYIGRSELALIGSALMYNVGERKSNGKVFGYNKLIEAGAGCCFVAGVAIVQSLVPSHENAIAVGAVTVSQDHGMVLSLAIRGSLFHNVAVDKVGNALPGTSEAEVGTLIAWTSSAAYRALSDHNKALAIPEIPNAMKRIWASFMAAAAFSFVSACSLWRSDLSRWRRMAMSMA
ncbi:Ff.00g062020.m01.CDS01 [Fusarium sp. VM40]|nr:Ff.00g062020.m01.CDS01 [Fusarium sp. VM40]